MQIVISPSGAEREHVPQCIGQGAAVGSLPVLPLHLLQLGPHPGGVPEAEGAQRAHRQHPVDGEDAPACTPSGPLPTPPQRTAQSSHAQCLCEYRTYFMYYFIDCFFMSTKRLLTW